MEETVLCCSDFLKARYQTARKAIPRKTFAGESAGVAVLGFVVTVLVSDYLNGHRPHVQDDPIFAAIFVSKAFTLHGRLERHVVKCE